MDLAGDRDTDREADLDRTGLRDPDRDLTEDLREPERELAGDLDTDLDTEREREPDFDLDLDLEAAGDRETERERDTLRLRDTDRLLDGDLDPAPDLGDPEATELLETAGDGAPLSEPKKKGEIEGCPGEMIRVYRSLPLCDPASDMFQMLLARSAMTQDNLLTGFSVF